MEMLFSLHIFKVPRMLHMPDLFSVWHLPHTVHPPLSVLPDRQILWPVPAPMFPIALAVHHVVFLLPSFLSSFGHHLVPMVPIVPQSAPMVSVAGGECCRCSGQALHQRQFNRWHQAMHAIEKDPRSNYRRKVIMCIYAADSWRLWRATHRWAVLKQRIGQPQ